MLRFRWVGGRIDALTNLPSLLCPGAAAAAATATGADADAAGAAAAAPERQKKRKGKAQKGEKVDAALISFYLFTGARGLSLHDPSLRASGSHHLYRGERNR